MLQIEGFIFSLFKFYVCPLILSEKLKRSNKKQTSIKSYLRSKDTQKYAGDRSVIAQSQKGDA